MKRLMTVVLFLMAAGLCAAQTTTYVMPTGVGASNCASNFTHPTSFYEFTCNINFLEQNGPGTGEMIGTNILNFNPTGFGIEGGTPYLSKKSKVLQDIAPANGQPGQATWEWQVQTQDGMYHVGTLTMQWHLSVPTRSGSRVLIDECETTVDVSTVAILD